MNIINGRIFDSILGFLGMMGYLIIKILIAVSLVLYFDRHYGVIAIILSNVEGIVLIGLLLLIWSPFIILPLLFIAPAGEIGKKEYEGVLRMTSDFPELKSFVTGEVITYKVFNILKREFEK
jgi:hypothetical protein